MDVYINRFLMLHQRLRRKQGWYKPTTVAATNREAYLEVPRHYHWSRNSAIVVFIRLPF